MANDENCKCDPRDVRTPHHDKSAHADEKNGPGATGWVNPNPNKPSDDADASNAGYGPAFGTPSPGNPGPIGGGPGV